MKKLILSGAMLSLFAMAFALMSLTTPKAKVHAPAKKPTTINFTIYNNTSAISVSWTFRLNGVEQTASNVLGPKSSTIISLPVGNYEVILNDAGDPPMSFHMEFNTGENYYSPGHTFWPIDVSSTASTTLYFY